MKQLFFTAIDSNKHRFIKLIEQFESREPIDSSQTDVSQDLNILQENILSQNTESQEYLPLDTEFDRLEYEYWKRVAGFNNDFQQAGQADSEVGALVDNRITELETALAQYGYFPPALGEPSRLVSGYLQPASDDSPFSNELRQEFVANGYLWRRTVERAKNAVLQSVNQHQEFWRVEIARGGDFFSLEESLIFGTENGRSMEDEFFENLSETEKIELIGQLNRWFERLGRPQIEAMLAN